MKNLLTALMLVWAPLAYAEPITSRVINGSPSPAGKWAWMASISESGSDIRQGHFCGGVLIDSTHVLTAAHCVVDYQGSPESLQVTLGRTKLSDNTGVTVNSAGLIIHPNYVPENTTNDIAIIRVEETGLNSFISPVSIDDFTLWDADSSATVIGWGFMDNYFPVRPDNLQEAAVPIVSDVICSERMGLDFDAQSMMCAGKLASSPISTDGADACSGDSGGPLIVESDYGVRLAGIVSWGYACGSDRYWGVYTRVAQYFDWIKSYPQVAPYVRTAPSVRGRPEVGKTLSCQKGEWGGEGGVRFEFEWFDAEEGLLKVSQKPTYRLKRSDIGRNLYCAVRAISGSSETRAETEETGVIFPTIKAMRAKGVSRRLAASQVGMSCNATQCIILLTASRKVIGTAVVMAGRSYRGRSVTDDSWTVRLPRVAAKSSNIFLRIVFADRSSELLEL